MGERRKSIPCSEEHWAATNGTLEKASSFTHNTSFSNACNHIKGTTTTFGIVPEVKSQRSSPKANPEMYRNNARAIGSADFTHRRCSSSGSNRRNHLGSPPPKPSTFCGSPNHGKVPPIAPSNPLETKEVTKLRWKRGKFLGQGAWGKVCLGLNQDTGQLMAVKTIEFTLKDTSVARKLTSLQHEIRMMKKLTHDNIVAYYCTERVGAMINIFMEFVPGGSIASLIKEFGTLSEATVKNYTRQILSALQYLHDNGVVHRDVKGANVLVSVHGICKLADFGTATTLDELKSATSGEMTGTPAWMAPEVIREKVGQLPCDVWSLGATMIEMFTAQPPFSHITTNSLQLMSVLASDDPLPSLPTLPSAEAGNFLKLCLVKCPRLRRTAAELISDSYLAEDEYETDTDCDFESSLGGHDCFDPSGVLYLGPRANSAMSAGNVGSPLTFQKNIGNIPKCQPTEIDSISPSEQSDNESDMEVQSCPQSFVTNHSFALEDNVLAEDVFASATPSPNSKASRHSKPGHAFKLKPRRSREERTLSMSSRISATPSSRRSGLGVEASRRVASKQGQHPVVEHVTMDDERSMIQKHLVGSCLSLINIQPEVSDVVSDYQSSMQASTIFGGYPEENDIMYGIRSTMTELNDDLVVSRVDSNPSAYLGPASSIQSKKTSGSTFSTRMSKSPRSPSRVTLPRDNPTKPLSPSLCKNSFRELTQSRRTVYVLSVIIVILLVVIAVGIAFVIH